MHRETIEYGLLVETALRQVVRDVLGKLQRDEVAQPHHFYITFRTTHSGVDIPDYLHERYPGEMTIVLQHQYWNLEVGETGFCVTLSFNDKQERLVIPYEAIKVFADPGVEFGLQFTVEVDEEADEAEERDDAPIRLERKSPAIVRERGDAGASETNATDGREAVADGDDSDGDDADEQDGKAGANIVALDRFRKK
ncbi:MAG: hypothetical protein KDF64_16810 [Geminicoccaceae bacterium]|nr:hypothetical protein [Geminicoccaceae bacterium]